MKKIKAYIDGAFFLFNPNHQGSMDFPISENAEDILRQSWGSVGHHLGNAMIDEVSTLSADKKTQLLEEVED